MKLLPSILALTLLAGHAAAQTYSIREVPPVSGAGPTYAWDINNAGITMAVSELADARGTDAVLHNAGGQVAVLPAISGTDLPYVWAGAINDAGTFVGMEVAPNFPLGTTARAFVSSLALLPTRFPLFVQTGPAGATDINDADPPVAAGLSGTGQYFGQTGMMIYRAYTVRVDGQNNPIVDLGTLGGPFSQAEAINDHGDVVGVSLSAAGPLHAFYAPAGQPMIDLGTLGGPASHAKDINNARVIVGHARLADGSARAFVWQNGVMTALPSLGGDFAEANAINTPGVIVGMALDALGRPRAVRFDAAAATDLNSLIPPASGWTLQYAQSINDSGAIVGWGRLNGQTRGFILEPASCYADCDGAGGLTANDFSCFLNRFAAGDPYANCDGVGALTANDFVCYINAFNSGCP